MSQQVVARASSSKRTSSAVRAQPASHFTVSTYSRGYYPNTTSQPHTTATNYAADRYSRTPSVNSAINRPTYSARSENGTNYQAAPSLAGSSRAPSVTSRASSATRRHHVHGDANVPVVAGSRSSGQGSSHTAAHHLMAPSELSKFVDAITIGEDGDRAFLRFLRTVGTTGHVKSLAALATSEYFEDASSSLASVRFAKRQLPLSFTLKKSHLLLTPVGPAASNGITIINPLGRSFSVNNDHLASTLNPERADEFREGGTRRPSVANSYDTANLLAKKGSARSQTTDNEVPLPDLKHSSDTAVPAALVIEYKSITKIRMLASEMEIETKREASRNASPVLKEATTIVVSNGNKPSANAQPAKGEPPSVVSIGFADRGTLEFCYRLLMCKAKGIVPPSVACSPSAVSVTHTFGGAGEMNGVLKHGSPSSQQTDFAAILPGQPLLESHLALKQQPELSRTVIIARQPQSTWEDVGRPAADGHFVRHPDYVVHEHTVRAAPHPMAEGSVYSLEPRKDRAAPRIDFSKEVQQAKPSVTRVAPQPANGFPSVLPPSAQNGAVVRPSPAPYHSDPAIAVESGTTSTVIVQRPVTRSSSAATNLATAVHSRISASPVPIPLRSPSEGGEGGRTNGISRDERKMLLIKQLAAMKAAQA